MWKPWICLVFICLNESPNHNLFKQITLLPLNCTSNNAIIICKGIRGFKNTDSTILINTSPKSTISIYSFASFSFFPVLKTSVISLMSTGLEKILDHDFKQWCTYKGTKVRNKDLYLANQQRRKKLITFPSRYT